jgi:hypothetical protein
VLRVRRVRVLKAHRALKVRHRLAYRDLKEMMVHRVCKVCKDQRLLERKDRLDFKALKDLLVLAHKGHKDNRVCRVALKVIKVHKGIRVLVSKELLAQLEHRVFKEMSEVLVCREPKGIKAM